MRAALSVCLLVGSVARAENGDEARTHQLASLLEVDAQLEVIRNAPAPTTVDETIAHLHAMERIIVTLSRAELDADAMRARLQHEEFESKNAHDLLEAGRERSVVRWNIAAVLVGSAASIVGAGTEFGDETAAKWGNGLLIAGSVVAATFSIVGLVKRDRGRLPLTIDTNLLAPLFDRAPTTRSHYPGWLWRYLDAPLADTGISIRRELIDKWTRDGRLPRSDGERRMALLCEPLGTARPVDAAALEARANMLADVRARVAELSVDLDRLWGEVQAQR